MNLHPSPTDASSREPGVAQMAPVAQTPRVAQMPPVAQMPRVVLTSPKGAALALLALATVLVCTAAPALPQVRLSMDHVTRMGMRFTTRSQGLGDISLSALYTIYGDVQTDHHRILFIPGLSLPTGSINERGDTPAGKNMRLPYPMQLGSGTFDLLPAVAYLGESENWAWMGHAGGTIRLGKNDNQYSLGNRLRFSAWVSRRLADEASVSAQVEGQFWGNIDGADPALNPMMVPTANPNLRAGQRIDLFLALNLYAPSGKLEGNRLAVEGGFPLYQSLDGPQLETDWQFKLVWNWTF